MQAATWNEAAAELRAGRIGVLPTDTVYGVHASALNQAAVERVRILRDRQADKPFIVLIGSADHLSKLGIFPTEAQRHVFEQLWPGPVSVVLAAANDSFEYLHRGSGTLAVRLPQHEEMLRLLKKTGPLISTSANAKGLPPATTCEQAKEGFGDGVDFYVDGGPLVGAPSTIISLEENGQATLLRPGAGDISVISHF
jgi:L-threonylcarbamoyladenylate synthase